VNNAGSISSQVHSRPAPPTSAARVYVISILILATIVGSSYWLYREGARSLANFDQPIVKTWGSKDTLKDPRSIIEYASNWMRHVAIGVGAGAGAFLLCGTLVVVGWRQYWVRRSNQEREELQNVTAQLEKTATDLALQKAERRRLEDELNRSLQELDMKVETRTAQLSDSHAKLQKEVNDRRQAERVMAQQAKELERSKDVLELHVQARTQELQKLQRRYESILNSAGEGIYGLDLQGRTTFVNPATAKITGWKVDDLIGKSESEVFHRRPFGESAIKSKDNGESDYVIFYRHDGTSFPAEYIRTPIHERDKEVGAVVIFKDITERKRAEETLNRKAAELARSNAELEQFAYVASHDLQEPLRKIQAFGDRLKTKCDAVNLQDGRDYLERMQSAAARMQTLINDLLTFSRVISASQPVVPVDLNSVIKGVLSDLEVRIEQTKAQIDLGDLPIIEGDPMQMRQLFQNLIGNALKFQPRDNQPMIKIAAKILKNPLALEEDPYSEQHEISIRDNGIGFDEKYLEKIFAVFQRLHGRNEFEGTGVGLAVCRRITDRHGGVITAQSKSNEGATFVVTLPKRQTGLQKAA
jgi:two-component system, LuxR family, sensor kinase FixL